MIKNVLNKDRCLFSRELFAYISDENFVRASKDGKSIGKYLGVYLVMFRVLNYEQNIIVYNYIYYPHCFFNCFLEYLKYRNNSYSYAIKE